MALIKFNGHGPVFSTVADLLEDFRSDIEKTIGADTYSTYPSANIAEHEDGFRIELAALGLTKENISIEIENNHLVVKGQGVNTLPEGFTYLRREFQAGNFRRTFLLPRTVDTENIAAKFENGILVITLPKKAEVKPRNIVIE